MSGIFYGCTGLKQAPEIPDSVANMEYAFYGCKALTQAPELPAGVTNMTYTFYGCTGLTQAPVLPSSITTINHTFSSCTALTQLPEIPNGVTDMNAAFAKCINLTQPLQIPDSVIDMSYAFYMCTGLTQMPKIPNSVTDMRYTFSGCTNLTGDIFIPNSVIRMLNIFTNTSMPITMKYSSDNTVAASAEVPANVTKVIDTLELLDGTIINMDNPVIEVYGNNVKITNGDTTPSSTDYTDFGSTIVEGGAVIREFTIKNNGNTTLVLSGTSPYITLSGTNASDFSVVTGSAISLNSGETAIFSIKFDPSSSGTKNARITIANNDGSNNPFVFDINGEGITTAPSEVASSELSEATSSEPSEALSSEPSEAASSEPSAPRNSTTPAMKIQSIICSMWKNGVFYGDSATGTKDADGNFVTTGKFTPDMAGDWTLNVKIGNTVSNTIAFKVLPSP